MLVAQHRLDVGDVVDGSDVAPSHGRRRWSLVARSVSPPTQSAEPSSRSSNRAKQCWRDGSHRTASTESPALIPPGWRALAVPVADAALPLSVGDRLDLVAAVGGTDSSESRSPAFVLAENALVVAVDEQSVTVAIPADDAPRVAFGIVTGSVVPALRSA